jgi:hypothetical protein
VHFSPWARSFAKRVWNVESLKHGPAVLDFRSPKIYSRRVSKKSGRIAELIESCRGKDWDAYYLGYFECFNRGLYFEAHDVL